LNQGDQIWRIFAQWAMIFIKHILQNYKSKTNVRATFVREKSYKLIMKIMVLAIYWADF
jgi:hypothetical protein